MQSERLTDRKMHKKITFLLHVICVQAIESRDDCGNRQSATECVLEAGSLSKNTRNQLPDARKKFLLSTVNTTCTRAIITFKINSCNDELHNLRRLGAIQRQQSPSWNGVVPDQRLRGCEFKTRSTDQLTLANSFPVCQRFILEGGRIRCDREAFPLDC